MPEKDTMEARWPVELRLSQDKKLLTVTFDNAVAFALPAEYLRVYSPSAEVKGHTPAGRKTVYGKSNVAISSLAQVGNYAVQIIFDDGHDTGYYEWQYLYDLGDDYTRKWAAYLDELAQKHLRREPLFPA
ncbi:DUF971 domain-containing protein [Microvirga sp. W0021]|uniref:DUF971 domain-containing protein n=1 Tax=Hohaiivirga grylli TaxID=3133970 RepID=A0ABV0BJL5_9HYPH